ncbi:hypothetical protein HUU61_04030 [Rhodopseudomonas palustris]|nr:hypothetical protein [Rhodopseudomonas palustris]
MNIHLKITDQLLSTARSDLDRPHRFAHERVGFFTAKATIADGILIILAADYQPVADEDYERDPNPNVGARIGSNAMRKALQFAYRSRASLLHVHSHGRLGQPQFSRVDLISGAEFVPGFFHAIPRMPHGMMVLSNDSANAMIWLNENDRGRYVSEISVIGPQIIKHGDPQ